MTKEKIYSVSRKIITREVCFVQAKNKKEAKEKAENFETVNLIKKNGQISLDGDWGVEFIIKDYDYKAEEINKEYEVLE